MLHGAGHCVGSRQSKFVFAHAGQWRVTGGSGFSLSVHGTLCILGHVATQTQVMYMHLVTA